MSLFGRSGLRGGPGYTPIAVGPGLSDEEMKEFSGGTKGIRVREYYSPSVDGNYLVISDKESSSCDEKERKKEGTASSETSESESEDAEDSDLDTTGAAASALTVALHLPTKQKRAAFKKGVTLECRSCTSELPVRMKNASAVIFKDEVCVGGGYTGDPATDCVIYTYNSPFDLWGSMRVFAPCKWFGMVVFNQKLVLVGGKQALGGGSSAECWNKLTVWDGDTNEWSHSLPPMHAARVAPTTFTHGSFLVVAGGRKGRLDYNVEVLNGDTMQWAQTSSLPLKCSPQTSLTHQGYWYLVSVELSCCLLYSRVEDILKPALAKRESGESLPSPSPNWSTLPLPPSPPLRMATVGNFLLAISQTTNNGKNLAIHAYSPDSQSWSHIGKVPAICTTASTIVTPEGELMFLGGDAGNYGYSNKVHKVAIATTSDVRKKARIVVTAAV